MVIFLQMLGSSSTSLEGSVYGLRTAPKAWFSKVVADLKKIGAIQHPLDQCVFMVFSKPTADLPARLIGAIRVYVDDFLFAESDSPEWKRVMKLIKNRKNRKKTTPPFLILLKESM